MNKLCFAILLTLGTPLQSGCNNAAEDWGPKATGGICNVDDDCNHRINGDEFQYGTCSHWKGDVWAGRCHYMNDAVPNQIDSGAEGASTN